MTEFWLSFLPDGLQSVGVSLEDQHVFETAFPISRVVEVIDCLEEHDILILGGDFWKRDEKQFLPTHENWYADETTVGSRLAVQTAAVGARTAIAKHVNDLNIWVVIVASAGEV